MAVLSADGSFSAAKLASTVFLGELGLDGRLRPVPGVLPSVAAAAAAGFTQAVVPPENAAEAALVPGVQVVSADSLAALLGWLKLTAGRDRAELASEFAGVSVAKPGSPIAVAPSSPSAAGQARDLADVVGQPVARRAAEICAAGGHHMLLLGPPGVGKTMPELKSANKSNLPLRGLPAPRLRPHWCRWPGRAIQSRRLRSAT